MCSFHHVFLWYELVSTPKRFLPSATKLRRLCFHRRVSVHGGGGCLVPGRVPGPGGSAPGAGWVHGPGGVPGPRGVCSGGMHGSLGGSAPRGGGFSQHALKQNPPGRDGYCCERYASHWNAFLLVNIFNLDCGGGSRCDSQDTRLAVDGPRVRTSIRHMSHATKYVYTMTFQVILVAIRQHSAKGNVFTRLYLSVHRVGPM